jgi:hypothetical protein
LEGFTVKWLGTPNSQKPTVKAVYAEMALDNLDPATRAPLDEAINDAEATVRWIRYDGRPASIPSTEWVAMVKRAYEEMPEVRKVYLGSACYLRVQLCKLFMGRLLQEQPALALKIMMEGSAFNILCCRPFGEEYHENQDV